MGVLESRHTVLRGGLDEEGGQSTVDRSGQRWVGGTTALAGVMCEVSI